MAKSAAPARDITPDKQFRPQIQAAVADGVSTEAMTLRLTLRDANRLSRDPTTPVADISYVGGEMRFLGVRVAAGGVPTSVLDKGEKAEA
jgi:hypothetical protein